MRIDARTEDRRRGAAAPGDDGIATPAPGLCAAFRALAADSDFSVVAAT
jgi:hypothetical protein